MMIFEVSKLSPDTLFDDGAYPPVVTTIIYQYMVVA